MQTGGSDAAEVSSHIAAKRQPCPVAHHQAPDQRSGDRPPGNRFFDRQASCQRSSEGSSQHNAEIHHGGNVSKYALLQCLGSHPLTPEFAGCRIPAQRLRNFGCPQGKSPSIAVAISIAVWKRSGWAL